MHGVVIIGAGHAGGTLAALLRQYGYADPITLLGAEPYAPYQRPPLSKAWLKGDMGGDDLSLRAPEFYSEQAIDFKAKTLVDAIMRDEKKVVTTDGFEISYDHLVIATGSKPRYLDGSHPPYFGAAQEGLDYHLLRTRDDAERLKPHLKSGAKIGLIGGGYVGLEVAATARLAGAEVTVFERESRLLARVASEPLSRFFEKTHQDQGVTVVTGASVNALKDGQITLADGREFTFDTVLVGIGGMAADDLAQMAQLACANGIVVDDTCLTSDPYISAIGDVTSRTHSAYAGRYRLESVPNALEQAKMVASRLTGRPQPKPEVPWFWSDQYDHKLQIAGLLVGVTQSVIRGAPDDGAFSVLHLNADGQLICAECVNAPADFMAAKLLIAKANRLEPTALVDTNVTLKSLMA